MKAQWPRTAMLSFQHQFFIKRNNFIDIDFLYLLGNGHEQNTWRASLLATTAQCLHWRLNTIRRCRARNKDILRTIVYYITAMAARWFQDWIREEFPREISLNGRRTALIVANIQFKFRITRMRRVEHTQKLPYIARKRLFLVGTIRREVKMPVGYWCY